MPQPPRTGRTTVCPTWTFRPRFWVIYRVEIVRLAVMPAPVQKKFSP